MPLTITGPPNRFLIQAMSFQLSVRSNCVLVQPAERGEVHCVRHVPRDIAEGVPPGAQHAAAPSPGFIIISATNFGVNLGGAVSPLRRSLWRCPRIWRSIVSTSAEHLAALARSISRSMKARSLHHVELEPERLGGVLGHVLDRADRHGRERERDAELLGRPRRLDLPIGVGHARGADRGDRHRQAHRLPQQRRAQIAVLEIDRYALPEGDLLEVVLVGPVCALGAGAGVDVVEELLGHRRLAIAFSSSIVSARSSADMSVPQFRDLYATNMLVVN